MESRIGKDLLQSVYKETGFDPKQALSADDHAEAIARWDACPAGFFSGSRGTCE
jgi:hypothetical protein